MRIKSYSPYIFLVILAGLCSQLRADAPADNGRGDRMPIYKAADGLIIDSIVIEPRNIYDIENPKYDNILFRTANKLHIVTNTHIVRRELLFAVGEPFSADAAQETARNLRTRLAVNTAWIEPVKLPNGHLLVKVITIDQWSLLASAQVTREGNETNYRFGLEERNFLGNHQYWNFEYYIQARDEDYHLASFRDSRLFGWPLQVSFADQNNPINTVREFSLSHPYYNQLQPFTLAGSVAATSARTDLYRNGARVAEWNAEGDLATLSGEYRWGSRFKKLGLGVIYNYRHAIVADRRIADGVIPSSIRFPVDSNYHLVAATASVSDIRYAVVSHIQRSVYPEDVTLGASIQGSLGRAFSHDFTERQFDEASIKAGYLQSFSANLVGLSFAHEFTFRDGNYFRKTSTFTAKFYNNYLSWFTLATQAQYVREWRADGLVSLHLGGRSGIRGYDPFYRTGSAMAVVNLEGRFFTNVEILSTVLGGVVFTDLGTVWQEDQRAFSQKIYRSIGVGLRLSLEKFTKEEIFRVDLSYGQENQWEISFSNHQYFSL